MNTIVSKKNISYKKDLSKMNFDNWEPIESVGQDSSRHTIWKCKCKQCGETQNINSSSLLRGRKIECEKCNATSSVSFTPSIPSVSSIPSVPSVPNATKNDSKLILKEVCMNIFDAPFYHYVVCCATQDAHWIGTTQLIAEKLDLNYYKVTDDIKQNPNKDPLTYRYRNVFFLLNQLNRYDSPNIDRLKLCLEDLKKHVIMNDIHYLTMTRLGCGKNRFDWNTEVKPIIWEVFEDVEKELVITVCSFTEPSIEPSINY